MAIRFLVSNNSKLKFFVSNYGLFQKDIHFNNPKMLIHIGKNLKTMKQNSKY